MQTTENAVSGEGARLVKITDDYNRNIKDIDEEASFLLTTEFLKWNQDGSWEALAGYVGNVIGYIEQLVEKHPSLANDLQTPAGLQLFIKLNKNKNMSVVAEKRLFIMGITST